MASKARARRKVDGNSKPSRNGFLDRTTFRTSREMDFFSAKELVNQTGHEVGDWPLVFIKEAIDNALDACEEADIPPVIDVATDAAGITVADNGPGLPEDTLKGAMDFTVRVSNREAYVSPCRGAQGNALKTLLPMPRVLDPDHGRLIVAAHGRRHSITCCADPISQRAVIHDDVTDVPKCKNRSCGGIEKASFRSGTEVRIEWGERESAGCVMWPFDDLEPLTTNTFMDSFADRFYRFVEGFAMLNPHATVRLNWFGRTATWKATNTEWEKWRPSQPTSIHWYEQANLERLVGAYVTHDRGAGTDRLVSDLVAEFDGLSGSQKRAAVLEESGLKRVRLAELVVNDRFDSKRIGALLASMKKHTRPVKPLRLGVVGKEHLRTRLYALGVRRESFSYKRIASKNGLPYVIETAFGWLGDEAQDRRRIFVGANWSVAIGNPFRSFGSTGEGLESVLADKRAGRSEPVVFVLHLAHPRVEYTDRGKTALVVQG
jgi:DNA topoisomerase VI subunit B